VCLMGNFIFWWPRIMTTSMQLLTIPIPNCPCGWRASWACHGRFDAQSMMVPISPPAPVMCQSYILQLIKCSCRISFYKNKGACAPRYIYSRVNLYHILPICPVLLQCELTGYILPYGLCVTWTRFLSGRRLLQPPNLQLWCLRFRHCGGK